LTDDSFDQVVAFYKGIGREYTDPRMQESAKSARLPDGREIRKAFLILDGASDVARSTHWVRIQHPFIGLVSMKGGAPQYSDVRDVSEIVVTERKPVPKDKEKK